MRSLRQFEVVAFLSQGLTDKEIAEQLGIGYRTIGCHVTEAMLKANVTKRVLLGAETQVMVAVNQRYRRRA